jgi:spermidine/putrescine transport system permease protein
MLGFTLLYVAWSIVPVLIAVLFSFNDGRSRSSWQGFSLRWWVGDEGSLAESDDLQAAMVNSVVLAVLTIAAAVPLGVALALGLSRWQARTAKASNAVMLLPFVTPEIVMGAAFFIVFTQLYTAVDLGRPAQLVGHVTFTLSYVVVIVRGRLAGVARTLDEAARDLGASATQAVRLVILPQLWPAVVASVVVVFATSIDDFVVSSFLSAPGADTVPMRIYGQARGGATPALNALATFILVVTLLVIGGGFAVIGMLRRRGASQGATGLDDFGGLRL